jgi:hypothetical protein
MGRNMSPDEAREEDIAAFPEGIGELYHELSSNVAHLHLNWNDYRALFGTSAERIEILNWAAPTFFGLLDGILLHNVLLTIARLTDPCRTSGHDNASLAQLVDKLKPFVDEALFADLQMELRDLEDHCATIRDMRNRILAHSDLATELGYHPEPAPGVSRAYVESVLERIRKLINGIAEPFLCTTVAYEHVHVIFGGERLMWVLENAYQQSVGS